MRLDIALKLIDNLVREGHFHEVGLMGHDDVDVVITDERVYSDQFKQLEKILSKYPNLSFVIDLRISQIRFWETEEEV